MTATGRATLRRAAVMPAPTTAGPFSPLREKLAPGA